MTIDPLTPFVPPIDSKTEKKPAKKESPIQEKAQKQIKGHEAEDAIGTKAKLKRQTSVSNFKSRDAKETELFEKSVPVHKTLREGIQKADQALLSQKSSALWECVGRRPDKFGGYIYIFRLRDEFDDVSQVPESEQLKRAEALEKKTHEILPALELPGSAVVALLPDKSKKITAESLILENGRLSEQSLNDLPGALGYASQVKSSGIYMELPDEDSIMARWEKLGERVTDLPSLKIASGEGIASDMDFVEIHITRDSLLSKGMEFVHDHLAHLLPTIQAKLDPSRDSYKEDKSKQLKLLVNAYRRILIVQREIEEGRLKIPKAELDSLKENMAKIQAGLGAFVDLTSGAPPMEKEQLDEHFFEVWDDHQFGDYWKNRFGTVDNAELGKIWGQMEQIVNQLDAVRKPKQTP